MNRSQRRAIAREQQKQLMQIGRMTENEKKLSMYRNGITAQDLKKNFDLGYQDGYSKGKTDEMLCIFGAFLIALRKQKDRWGKRRCIRILNAAFKECAAFVDETEAVNKVFRELDIRFRTDDPFDPFIDGSEV